MYRYFYSTSKVLPPIDWTIGDKKITAGVDCSLKMLFTGFFTYELQVVDAMLRCEYAAAMRSQYVPMHVDLCDVTAGG